MTSEGQRREAVCLGGLVKRRVEHRFGRVVEREIGDLSTVGADQVVVVLREVFGEFVAREVVAGDDASDRPDLFEDREVTIHAGLRQGPVGSQDLRDRDGAAAVLQHVDHAAPAGGVPLVGSAQQCCHLFVHIGFGHPAMLPGMRTSENVMLASDGDGAGRRG